MGDVIAPEERANLFESKKGQKLAPAEKAKLLSKDNDPNWRWTRITKVPDWLYEETVTIWWWCGAGGCCPIKITKASFVWIANLVALLAHCAGSIFAVWGATRDGKTMATPLLKVYLTNLTWIPDSSDALIPAYQEAGGLYLAHMTLWFFLLSAIAHALVCFGNFYQAFAFDSCTNKPDPTWSRINYWTGWYYVYLHECRNPLRCAPTACS